MGELFCGPPRPSTPRSQPLRAAEAFPPVCTFLISMLNFYSLNQKQTQHMVSAAHRSSAMHLPALVAVFSPLSPKLMKTSFSGFCNTNPHPLSSLLSHSPYKQTASMERWYTTWSHAHMGRCWGLLLYSQQYNWGTDPLLPRAKAPWPVKCSGEGGWSHDLLSTVGKVVGTRHGREARGRGKAGVHHSMLLFCTCFLNRIPGVSRDHHWDQRLCSCAAG